MTTKTNTKPLTISQTTIMAVPVEFQTEDAYQPISAKIRFFNLPGELRNIIYSYSGHTLTSPLRTEESQLRNSDEHYYIPTTRYPFVPRTNLLQVCRRFNQEYIEELKRQRSHSSIAVCFRASGIFEWRQAHLTYHRLAVLKGYLSDFTRLTLAIHQPYGGKRLILSDFDDHALTTDDIRRKIRIIIGAMPKLKKVNAIFMEQMYSQESETDFDSAVGLNRLTKYFFSENDAMPTRYQLDTCVRETMISYDLAPATGTPDEDGDEGQVLFEDHMCHNASSCTVYTGKMPPEGETSAYAPDGLELAVEQHDLPGKAVKTFDELEHEAWEAVDAGDIDSSGASTWERMLYLANSLALQE